MEELHKPDAALGERPREQAVFRKARFALLDAVAREVSGFSFEKSMSSGALVCIRCAISKD
jgi:hypothetical protein